MKECNDLYQFKLLCSVAPFIFHIIFYLIIFYWCSANSKLLTHVKGLPLVLCIFELFLNICEVRRVGMPISNPFKSCTNSTIGLQVQPNMHLESKVAQMWRQFWDQI